MNAGKSDFSSTLQRPQNSNTVYETKSVQINSKLMK
jgi:hypothetical protein